MTTAADNYTISVTFRHTESTDALKNYATEKVTNCLEKYISHPADIHVILTVEKRDHQAEVTVRSKDYNLTAKADTDNLYSSIDKVISALDAQARKLKGKLVDHKSQPLRETVVQ